MSTFVVGNVHHRTTYLILEHLGREQETQATIATIAEYWLQKPLCIEDGNYLATVSKLFQDTTSVLAEVKIGLGTFSEPNIDENIQVLPNDAYVGTESNARKAVFKREFHNKQNTKRRHGAVRAPEWGK